MTKRILHYYGDTVRQLFVLAALVMVVSLPFFTEEIGQPLIISLVAILLVGMAAGLTSPRHTWTATFNVFISIGGFLTFEDYAVDWYSRYGSTGSFFWTNQLLAVIFLLALYFSLKTFRRAGRVKVQESMNDEDDDSVFFEKSDAGGDGK